MPHLFADDDDTFALSDELERLINEHLPSPAAVLRAATYEMARALRHLPPLKLATNIDSSTLCYAMDKVLRVEGRPKPRLAAHEGSDAA